MNPIFKNRNGDVSAYALACGYVQTRTISSNVERTLWHEGGPCYHVRQHDFNSGTRIFWFSSPSLTECRRVFKARNPAPLIKRFES